MSEKPVNEPGPGEADFREELSAFMDGELDADRARFLMQRLRHDAGLRAQWQRWQLQSATMRRQAQPLPTDFADRVSCALDAEAVRAVPVRNRTLRWAGGAALAASFAIAGVFVFDAIRAPQADTATIAASRPATAPAAAAQVATRQSAPSPAVPANAANARSALAENDPKIRAPRVEAARIALPIPVHDGVVSAYRSPLRPLLVRHNRPQPQFAPFPQPFTIDPELAAYLERQKSGDPRDPFTGRGVNPPAAGDDSVRTVAYPQGDQR